jgi:hypothetical protein
VNEIGNSSVLTSISNREAAERRVIIGHSNSRLIREIGFQDTFCQATTVQARRNNMSTKKEINRELIEASETGDIESVKLKLAADANVHADGDAALRLASSGGYAEIVKLLLTKNADVHAWNNYALSMASARGYPKVVKLLLAAGANVHDNDELALLRASQRGHTDVVSLLLAAGAKVHDEMLDSARAHGQTEIVELLDAQRKVQAEAGAGAVARHSVEKVSKLIRKGKSILGPKP